MRARVFLAVFLLGAPLVSTPDGVPYTIAATPTPSTVTETESWRVQRERDLKSDTGWLTVAGLVFLKPGVNTIGTHPDSDVHMRGRELIGGQPDVAVRRDLHSPGRDASQGRR